VVRDNANSAASSTPPAIASASAASVMRTVNHQLVISEPKLSASVDAISDGAGSR
jgi:hypothetical protein